MKELVRDRAMIHLAHYRALLEHAGIPTFIRNENLSQLEAPIPVFSPALCVVQDEDYDRAVAILRQSDEAAATAPGNDRACPACGEMNPGSFDYCWNCEAEITA